MNRDEASGSWKQFKGKCKEQWGKLTDDDLSVIEGRRDQLIGKIQERYGYARAEAEREVNEWESRHNDPHS
ncbi:CsbD family protein [Pantoea sp. M_9]|uniref:CsbD family protein n=1 Tax=Pantoea sp. M_9 TaxID=2608041 RepID=UPI001232AEDA|nr:CsbD family protein [Pantoea sp. M_9]KAA5967459.1 CsbD family protein [Pantoea sp. M_9]